MPNASRLRPEITAAGLAMALLSAVPSHAAEPAPGRVAENRSHVTATVLSRRVWPPGSLENVRPLLPSDRAFHSLQIKIVASEPAAPGVSHLAAAGRTIDVFSEQPMPETLVGKTIHATITLAGGTEGLRWMIEKLEPLP